MPDTLAYYYPRLRMTAPGAPEMLMGDSIIRAMAHIASQTGAFKRDMTPIAYVSGTPAYDFTVDAFRIVDFHRVWFEEDSTATSKDDQDAIPLTRKSNSDLLIWLLDDESAQRPEFFSISAATPGEVNTYPNVINPVLANAQLRAKCDVVPTRPVAEGYAVDPDIAHWGTHVFFHNAEETIFNMAAAYLLDYPGKPWTNRTQGKEFMIKALFAMGELKTLADDDMRPGVARTVKYGGY